MSHLLLLAVELVCCFLCGLTCSGENANCACTGCVGTYGSINVVGVDSGVFGVVGTVYTLVVFISGWFSGLVEKLLSWQ